MPYVAGRVLRLGDGTVIEAGTLLSDHEVLTTFRNRRALIDSKRLIHVRTDVDIRLAQERYGGRVSASAGTGTPEEAAGPTQDDSGPEAKRPKAKAKAKKKPAKRKPAKRKTAKRKTAAKSSTKRKPAKRR